VHSNGTRWGDMPDGLGFIWLFGPKGRNSQRWLDWAAELESYWGQLYILASNAVDKPVADKPVV